MDAHYGKYRAIVQAVNDPEQRKRHRVRVIGVHRDELPIDGLPWAELCVPAGKGFGDIPAYEVGDPVWVTFERGDRRFPVIEGGWLSYQGGTNDLPSEQAGDYAKNQQRWVRLDRAGNRIVMSPLAEELFIELQSGEARITVRGLDGSIEVESDNRVTVRAPQVQVLEATDVSVQSDRLVAQIADEATVQCEGDVNIQGASRVNLGKYQPPTSALVPPPAKTSDAVNLDANQMVHAQSAAAMEFIAGTTIDVDAQGDLDVHSAANITINGDAKVEVNSNGGPVNVNANEVNVASDTAKVTIAAQTDLEVSSATAKVKVTAATDVEVVAGGNASVQVTGDADIDVGGAVSVTSQGNATVNAAGYLSLNSQTRIELIAPIITLDADSSLVLSTGGTLQATYSVGLFG